MFNEILNYLLSLSSGPIMMIFLVGTGIYLSLKTNFMQFTHFKHIMKKTIGTAISKENAGKGELSSFQALTTALAATVGTGNIAGVAGAITVGGPGAIFWMWISAFFGMITKYAEVVLAVKYRERNENGDYVGGPMYYIRNGLGSRFSWLATLFCIFGALAAFGIGNMTQVNTIANSINALFKTFNSSIQNYSFQLVGQTVPFTSLIIGIITAVIVGLVLFGGIKRIGQVTEKLVPVMAIIYVICSSLIILVNIHHIPTIIATIFKGAFNAKAALGGAVGITILTTIQKGIGRGVFANEAGLGSAPMAHATTTEQNPVTQGLTGIFEVFMVSFVICTMTALVLMCGYYNGVDITWGQSYGADIISSCIGTLFGNHISAIIITISITLFALSTLLTWSLYGTRCFEFIFGQKNTKLYQIIFIIGIVVGACLKLELVWTIADMLNGFMAVPNLIALIGLSPIVIQLTKDYFSK